VVGYWDFPVSSLVPILCHRFDLPGPALEGVLRCEHKYWSRLEQSEVIDEHPHFGLVSFDNPTLPRGVGFPVWLKPVKSASSELAFKACDETELRDAVAHIRERIDEFGRPFDLILDHAELPAEIGEVGGRACLVEEAVTGRQFTVEGYCVDDDPHVYGVVESVLYPGRTSFHRYQYPASLPAEVTERLTRISTAVMRRMRVGSGTFNIEYFWDPDTDRINLLEINPRLSQSHAQLFECVDGVSNLHALVELGLGREPEMSHGQGRYAVAAKVFPRAFHDAVVTHAPSPEEVAGIEREIPGVIGISADVEEGTRLSDVPHQNSYSCALGSIVVAADDEQELLTTYERCVEALGYQLEDVDEREQRA
jgi:biotin carboxylase